MTSSWFANGGGFVLCHLEATLGKRGSRGTKVELVRLHQVQKRRHARAQDSTKQLIPSVTTQPSEAHAGPKERVILKAMKACVLERPGPVESPRLELRELPVPQPGEREVLVRVHSCGICRTDLARG